MKACDFFSTLLYVSLVATLLAMMVPGRARAQCGGSCGACTRRFGCMTTAWGKCCTQFYMHNGKKRAAAAAAGTVDWEGHNLGRMLEFYLLRNQEPSKPDEHHWGRNTRHLAPNAD